MPAEKKTIPISIFTGGERPDDGREVRLPGWRKLLNVWFPHENTLYGRPHFIQHNNFDSIVGFAKTAKEELITYANGQLYLDAKPIGGFTGNGPMKYDYFRDQTVITAGGGARVWSGSNLNVLPVNNCKSMATFHGATKERVCYVTTDNPRVIKYTNWGDPTDLGTLISDGVYNDEWTEGGESPEFPEEIVDIVYFSGEIIVFTLGGIYRYVPGVDEVGFDISLYKFGELSIRRVQPRRIGPGILFIAHKGQPVIYTIGQTGPTLNMIPLEGLSETIRKSFVEGEAFIDADETRNLIYYKPNNSDGKTWVFNPGKNWTSWDVSMKDKIEVNGVIYAALTNKGDSFSLSHRDTNQLEPYEIQLTSGSTAFTSPVTKKRFKTVGMKVITAMDFEYQMEILTEDIEGYKPILERTESGLMWLEKFSGASGRFGTLVVTVKNFDEFIMNCNNTQDPSIWVEVLEKVARQPEGRASGNRSKN